MKEQLAIIIGVFLATCFVMGFVLIQMKIYEISHGPDRPLPRASEKCVGVNPIEFGYKSLQDCEEAKSLLGIKGHCAIIK